MPKTMPPPRRAIRYPPADANRSAPKPSPRGLQRVKSPGAMRSMSSEIRCRASRRDKEEKIEADSLLVILS